jgi:hypothetical protein
MGGGHDGLDLHPVLLLELWEALVEGVVHRATDEQNL